MCIRDRPPTEQALLKSLVENSVGKSLHYEAANVEKAAKNESNFIEWLDSFYTQWIENSSTTPEMQPAFIAHAVESKRALLDVAGSTTQTNLPSAVADCVATWTDRGEVITNTILKEK